MPSRILALSFFPAFLPPKTGGVERLYRLYLELSNYFDVTLISSSYMDTDCERVVVEHGATFREIRVPKDRHFQKAYATLAANAGEGDLSGPALGMACDHFGPLHAEYLRQYPTADLIIHDSPFLIRCDLFRGFDSKPRVYQSYNFETGLYGGFHSKGDHRDIERLVRELEEETCRSSDLITGCAPEDLQAFRDNFAPEGRLTIVPNGFVPSAGERNRSRSAGPKRLLFLGSGHRPNVEAVEVIRTVIAPALPDVEFHIVGSAMPAGRARNVIAHGVVDRETKQDLLDSATAAINPMISGSGSSLKVVDIADRGVPLLSTSVGARGFDLQPGKHYWLLEPDSFVADVRKALEDTAALETAASASSDHFRERFTWASIARRFADELEVLLGQSKPQRPLLMLNDYDSFAEIGGGGTRTRGLAKGLSDTATILFLTFGDSNEPVRRLELEGKLAVIRIPKAPEHTNEHVHDHAEHWVSTADLVNYKHAPRNEDLIAAFEAAAGISSTIICEHPYMVGLPRLFGVDFVYSSQNYEHEMKRAVLAGHPRADQLLALSDEAERFACGAARFIVAVSDKDARTLGATYRITAPIMVIPNGSDGPDLEALDQAGAQRKGSRPVAVFMGSAHLPNTTAAEWIVEELAPAHPTVEFLIIGSVGESLSKPGPNVVIAGQVSAEQKTRMLAQADVAINPMMSGSGSNIKVADFLQHGLPVLSTSFGARGYDHLPSEDVQLAELATFGEALRTTLRSAEPGEIRRRRQERYALELSMAVGGRALAVLLEEHSGARPRALYATYRYNEPQQGGGEAYVVRLVHALAKAGWFVDVVSPAAEGIEDVGRFAARFSGKTLQPVPLDQPRVRTAKFPLDEEVPDRSALERFWKAQPAYEAALLRNLPAPGHPSLAWGWAEAQSTGRWCLRDAGLFLPAAGAITFECRAETPVVLQITTEAGELIVEAEVHGRGSFGCRADAGFARIRCSPLAAVKVEDPRPLGLYVTSLTVDGLDILQQSTMDAWLNISGSNELLAAHQAAFTAAREGEGLRLTDLRTGSRAMLNYIDQHAADYDLIITHNAVFGVASHAVQAGKAAGVPTVLLPHFHFEDDFYYFEDVLGACADATVCLVSPHELVTDFRSRGLDNVRYHSPGIDTNLVQEEEQQRQFRELLGRDDPFVLVLGRKAGAKGYEQIIAAAEQLEKGPLIVLIGPDDDGKPVSSDRAVYLGPQPRSIVLGALAECAALANFSHSESFGIVLLEAGLAGKPVLANRACAAFRDLIDDGVNGYLVDERSLPLRMMEIIQDKQLQRQLGAEGRRRALLFDWGEKEREFVDLCNNLVPAP